MSIQVPKLQAASFIEFLVGRIQSTMMREDNYGPQKGLALPFDSARNAPQSGWAVLGICPLPAFVCEPDPSKTYAVVMWHVDHSWIWWHYKPETLRLCHSKAASGLRSWSVWDSTPVSLYGESGQSQLNLPNESDHMLSLCFTIAEQGVVPYDIAGRVSALYAFGEEYQWWAFLPRTGGHKATGRVKSVAEGKAAVEAYLLAAGIYGRPASTAGASGEERKAAGAAAVNANARQEWKARVDLAIDSLCIMRPTFTVDDIRAIAGDPPAHPNAFGARIIAAMRGGKIANAGYQKSTRPEAHARVIPVYRRRG